jgi:hypothetical protein
LQARLKHEIEQKRLQEGMQQQALPDKHWFDGIQEDHEERRRAM